MDSLASSLFLLRPSSIPTWAQMDILNVLGRRSTYFPLDQPHSPLDTWGVAGLFGGDEAVSAMSAVHVYEKRRWLGWYNSPGSFQIAKRLRLFARSRYLDSHFPGVDIDLATLDKLDYPTGPKFRATHSGTIIEQTGYLAALFVAECATREGRVVEGRISQTVGVTVAKLSHAPASQMYPRRINAYSPVLASIPIAVSVATCAACGIFDDWCSSMLIFSGILTSGISCLVIGSGELMFTHPDPPQKCPAGDGILGTGKEIVLLKGAEGAVNSITRGKFSLKFSSERQYKNLGWCCFFLKIQSIAQLFLVPKASAFGQVMFVTSLGVSWVYNSWLSSDKKKIQRDILLDSVLAKPVLTRYILGTRTTAVVFILLVLQPEEPRKILDELLPNDTKVWSEWKRRIVALLPDEEKLEFAAEDWELDGFTESEQSLLKTLYGDATAAYNAYVQYVQYVLPE